MGKFFKIIKQQALYILYYDIRNSQKLYTVFKS